MSTVITTTIDEQLRQQVQQLGAIENGSLNRQIALLDSG
jgi:hypothetical protein